ncbi:MAG TPA: hypothetical protein VKO42_04605, partial [Patescibacteria group bacterium]|nr:hypothetical protein [Patescibacteria group bacterium]
QVYRGCANSLVVSLILLPFCIILKPEKYDYFEYGAIFSLNHFTINWILKHIHSILAHLP